MRFASSQKGFSLVELMIVVIVVMIVAAIAAPNLLSSRRSSNEASALSAVRITSQAETAYQTTYGGGNYGTAAQLHVAHLIDNMLAAANNVNVGGNPPRNTAKGGYRFRIQVTNAVPGGAAATYVVSAIPATPSGVTQTGAKRICLTDASVLKGSTQNLSLHYNYAQCGFANPFVP